MVTGNPICRFFEDTEDTFYDYYKVYEDKFFERDQSLIARDVKNNKIVAAFVTKDYFNEEPDISYETRPKEILSWNFARTIHDTAANFDALPKEKGKVLNGFLAVTHRDYEG